MTEKELSNSKRVVEISQDRGHSGGNAATTIVTSANVSQARVALESLWQERAKNKQPSGSHVLALVYHAWRNILQSTLTSIITVMTVATAVLLLTLTLVVLQNLRGTISNARQDFSVSIFLKERSDSVATDAASVPTVQQLSEELQSTPEVAKVTLRSKDQALQEFRTQLGPRAGLLDGLDQKNPLPASLEVRLKPELATENVFAKLAARYQAHPLVEEVQYSQQSLRQIGTALRLFEKITIGLVLVGVLSSIFLIATTITLALYAHREEIEIMRLVGATHSRIRAPYLIEGTFEGLLGGVLGIFGGWLIYSGVHGPLAQSEILRGLVENATFIGPFTVAVIVLSAAVIGALGSFLAVRRFSRF